MEKERWRKRWRRRGRRGKTKGGGLLLHVRNPSPGEQSQERVGQSLGRPRLRNGAELPEPEAGGQPSTLRRTGRAHLPQWRLALASAVSGAPCRSHCKPGRGGCSSSSPSPPPPPSILLQFVAHLSLSSAVSLI